MKDQSTPPRSRPSLVFSILLLSAVIGVYPESIGAHDELPEMQGLQAFGVRVTSILGQRRLRSFSVFQGNGPLLDIQGLEGLHSRTVSNGPHSLRLLQLEDHEDLDGEARRAVEQFLAILGHHFPDRGVELVAYAIPDRYSFEYTAGSRITDTVQLTLALPRFGHEPQAEFLLHLVSAVAHELYHVSVALAPRSERVVSRRSVDEEYLATLFQSCVTRELFGQDAVLTDESLPSAVRQSLENREIGTATARLIETSSARSDVERSQLGKVLALLALYADQDLASRGLVDDPCPALLANGDVGPLLERKALLFPASP